MSLTSRSSALALACLAFAACPDDTTNQSTDTSVANDTTNIGTFETTQDTSSNPTDTTQDTKPPEKGEKGAACLGNEDCDSGWCVEGEDGYICTETCISECDEGYDCKSVQVQGDIVFLCVPRVVKLCSSCIEDFQCNGGACVDIDGEQRCASSCENNDDCVPGYECKEAGPADQGLWCLPISGNCDCSPPYEGIARPCSNGECRGTEVCDPLIGWVGCTAPEPTGESCNYVDDDCDGDVDETYKTGDLYLTKRACGGCEVDCDDALPNTAETTCVEVDGLARCQVVECDNGYQQISPYVCAPDLGGCIQCTNVAECVGVNASCTQLDDGKYCTYACSDDDDCADGFECETVPESTSKQCVPESGSCTCDGSNPDLQRSCTVTYTPPDGGPTTTCRGIEQCTDDGFGPCQLPTESCDGIDEDCDGVIDGPFKNAEGKYKDLANCGACGVSCLAFGGPNAAPACDTTPAVPQCGYTCVGNAVDVNGIAEDGCECKPVGGPDLADDSIDSNCDGIDGEVDNGIFVSKNGDDSNPGTRELPVLTINAGITKAKQGNKRDTYVATGVYSENVVLQDGVGVFGGYSPFYDEHDTTLFEVAIVGQAPDAEHIGTVTALNVGNNANVGQTVLYGFTVFGINAANLAGQNSYGIYVNASGSRLRLSKNRVFAGPGGGGTNGSSGTDGAQGVSGNEGADAQGLLTTCSATTTGGTGGTLTCGSTTVSGGAGGNANCPDWDDAPTASQGGVAGQGASPAAGGEAGWDWLICAEASCGTVACDLCQFPQGDNRATGEQGHDGTDGNDGSAGQGCQNATGSVVNGQWRAGGGTDGGAGAAGSGGGGGGAGGGVEVRGASCSATAGDDDLGGAGGGGGSGGCGAQPGLAATGGGGSFGIFLVLAGGTGTPTITGNSIQNGRGGSGGNGGLAGVGGLPGFGGEGGASGDTFGDVRVRCASGGGNGGNGGAGGHGGGGGGGCGGSAFGIYATGTPPQSWKSGNTFVSGGVGGAGGKGGASLEPTSKGRDGSDGFSVNANF